MSEVPLCVLTGEEVTFLIGIFVQPTVRRAQGFRPTRNILPSVFDFGSGSVLRARTGSSPITRPL